MVLCGLFGRQDASGSWMEQTQEGFYVLPGVDFEDATMGKTCFKSWDHVLRHLKIAYLNGLGRATRDAEPSEEDDEGRGPSEAEHSKDKGEAPRNARPSKDKGRAPRDAGPSGQMMKARLNLPTMMMVLMQQTLLPTLIRAVKNVR